MTRVILQSQSSNPNHSFSTGNFLKKTTWSFLPSTTYYFRICSYNSLGDSSFSNEANATTYGEWPWSFYAGSFVVSSPAIGPDGTIYVGSEDGNLFAITENSGGLADSPWPMYLQNERHTAIQPAFLENPFRQPDLVLQCCQ